MWSGNLLSITNGFLFRISSKSVSTFDLKMGLFVMRLLIIDQEAKFARRICKYLEDENYRCEIAYTLEDGKRMIEHSNFECILLNISISEDNGLNFLKDLRKNRKKEGVIVLSEKKSVEETITSLTLGADDYLTKPIHLAELSARIKAIIRRKYSDLEKIRFRNLIIDTLARAATIDDKKINLTRSEYELLLLLVINKGRVISKEEIAARLSGQSAVYLYNFDVLYTHIKNLKRKLLPAGINIETIYASGYILSE